MNTTYLLSVTDATVTDGVGAVFRLHDLPRDPDNWRVEALIASDDFCETVAASLEQIAAALPSTSVEQYQIQDLIGNLLYAQRHYKLVRRNPRRPLPGQRSRTNT